MTFPWWLELAFVVAALMVGVVVVVLVLAVGGAVRRAVAEGAAEWRKLGDGW